MKKYQIIYADPPWSYNVASSKGTSRGVAERYYPVMKPEKIKELPISRLSEGGGQYYFFGQHIQI